MPIPGAMLVSMAIKTQSSESSLILIIFTVLIKITPILYLIKKNIKMNISMCGKWIKFLGRNALSIQTYWNICSKYSTLDKDSQHLNSSLLQSMATWSSCAVFGLLINLLLHTSKPTMQVSGSTCYLLWKTSHDYLM